MKLEDGLTQYQNEQAVLDFARRLERVTAPAILGLLEQYGDHPPETALVDAKGFILQVEEWKSLCNRNRVIDAIQNPSRRIWDSLLAASTATDDEAALLSVMDLRGFGAAHDSAAGKRHAKMASAVLRFLWPKQWGVVDWRNAGMLMFCERSQWDIDAALNNAHRMPSQQLRHQFDVIDPAAAIEYNTKYRRIARQSGLAGAAEVDMAIFGLSLVAWPLSRPSAS